jgi:outer membrane protein W
MERVDMQSNITPRFTIGGMHFWGHADFFVTFNLASQTAQTDGLQYGYQLGVETGARFYPWRVERDALRPFVGVSWSSGNYTQRDASKGAEGAGATVRLDRALLSAGLTYQIGDVILEGGGKFVPNTTIDYWVSRDQQAQISLPNTAFWLGAKYVFDTTIGEELREKKQPGYAKEYEKILRQKDALNTWTIAAGPSSATALTASTYTIEKYTFANANMSANQVALDFGIGYWLYDADVQLNLSYRPLVGSHSAYGVRQAFERHAFAAEAFKFVGDFHGFCPYVGAFLGYEAMNYRETDGDKTIVNQQEWKFVPGVVFGWDIRPSRNDAWFLRTNLRYTPFSTMNVSGKDLILPNFEFNFIQLVVNLNRIFL